MCGIFFSAGFENLQSSVIDSVTHRGPDDRGWKEFVSPIGSVVLAHRRLAIIDLTSDGHQPASTEDGRFWITYNGEIYNYLELRAELMSFGHTFNTQTDTEVLLKSYLQWGVGCLQKFNGMFAFAIWDDKHKCVFAARDRFGVKPLYFYKNGNKIALASEIKQLLNIPTYNRKINSAHFAYFLENEYHPIGNTTIFSEILHIEPGHYLRFDQYDFNIAAWYTGNDYKSACNEPKNEFLMLFEDAIKKRLIADVPAGALLSGGLDSSSIVCMIAKLIEQEPAYNELKTFTSWSQDPLVNEREYSEAIVAHTGIKNHLAEINDMSLRADIQNIIYHQEEPFFSTSIQSEWNVYRTIAQETELKVVLDGQGSDELLCGYLYMIPHLLSMHIKSGRIVRGLSEYCSTVRQHKTLSPYTLAFDTMALVTPKTIAMLQKMRGKKFDYKKLDRFNSISEYTHYLLRRSIEPQLRWQDRSSMAFSIESRQPFLDYRLVEFLISLNITDKFKNGTTKSLLRNAMYGILPEKVRNRISKFGFPSPQATLMNNIDKNYFDRYLTMGMAVIDKFDNKKYASKLCAYKQQGIMDPKLFMPFSLGVWQEVFEVSV